MLSADISALVGFDGTPGADLGDDGSVFKELLATPGVEEHHHLAGTVGFMAFHGGNLERVTDLIATEAAAASGASLYTVCQPEGVRNHIPSNEFDPALSEPLAEFLDHVDLAIAIHGFGRIGFFTTLLLGGQNRPFAGHVARHLRPHLPHYEILDTLDQIPKPLRGVHPKNPVNRTRRQGVQIELPPRIRGLTPYWGEAEGTRVPHIDDLINGLSEAARTAQA